MKESDKQNLEQLIELQEKVRISSSYLKFYYSKVKRATVVCTLLSLLCFLSTLLLTVTFERSKEIIEFCLFIFSWSFLLLYFFNKKNSLAKIYTRGFHRGFKYSCQLADYADWGPTRKYFYFKNEELAVTKRVISEFYSEFNKSYSPVRPYKNLYKILSAVQNVAVVISIIIFAYTAIVNIIRLF